MHHNMRALIVVKRGRKYLHAPFQPTTELIHRLEKNGYFLIDESGEGEPD
jgi:hypothetical protein